MPPFLCSLHGSNSATSPAFVRVVNPSVNVIQVSAENDYGHPTEEVLTTLAGRIHIISDGRQMWIDAENK